MTHELKLNMVCKHGMLDGDLLCSQCKEERMQPTPETRQAALDIQRLAALPEWAMHAATEISDQPSATIAKIAEIIMRFAPEPEFDRINISGPYAHPVSHE